MHTTYCPSCVLQTPHTKFMNQFYGKQPSKIFMSFSHPTNVHSKLRWWNTTVSVADQQHISVMAVYRSSLFPFTPGFATLTTMTWSCHVLGLCVMVRAVSVSRHPTFRTRCRLISKTEISFVNSYKSGLKTWLLLQAYSTLIGVATEHVV